MTAEQWMRENLPKKPTLSMDAVEILVKLAWEEATKTERHKWEKPKQPEIIGPYHID